MFQNKSVFITGGSLGIGRSIAQSLLELGAHVTIASRNQKHLNEAITYLAPYKKSPTQRLTAASLDVTQVGSVKAVVANEISQNGIPDFVINSAGYSMPGYLDTMEYEHLQSMINLNYLGTAYVCRAFLPKMIEQAQKGHPGHIINVSSLAGFIGLFGYTGYCASKYAIIGFSEALRAELKPYGIKVSVLCPPNTLTPGLEEENKHKPIEVLKTEEKAKTVTPDWVASELIKGVMRGKKMIIPTFDGVLAYYLSKHAPKVLDQFVKRPVSVSELRDVGGPHRPSA